MKGFWSDGLSIHDLEKIILCICFVAIVGVMLYVYLKNKMCDSNIVYAMSVVGGLLVIRKSVKYNFDAKTLLASFGQESNEQNKQNTTY
jgi:undecaprenyl pyrophosphate phosphatase UppP